MKIAIIGSGISGLVAAYLLYKRHDITVYEADGRIGGHANTVSVSGADGVAYQIDTGFVVFNEPAYPNFAKLLARLGVASQPSEMSFSVTCEATGLEYGSRSLSTLFAQRRNLFRSSFYRMLLDIRRFFREAREVLSESEQTTLGQFLSARGYSRSFIDQHLIPLGAAIWSAPPEQLEEFPAREFVQFFENHGFLRAWNRSPWRTVTGGSQRYVEALAAPFRNRIHVATPIRAVRREATHVEVDSSALGKQQYDHVVIATHSDQALSMLSDPSPEERQVLGALPYQENDTVLHTDARLLPNSKRAWSSWNFYKPRHGADRATITYCMNALQSLGARETYCVSLNRTTSIDTKKIIRRMTYYHPVYNERSFAARQGHDRINGVRRTYFCGAYWGYGFHEDGVRSALAVGRHFGVSL